MTKCYGLFIIFETSRNPKRLWWCSMILRVNTAGVDKSVQKRRVSTGKNSLRTRAILPDR